jgi:hypothetical protein
MSRFKIPAWVKEEFDAYLQVLSSLGAEGLTTKFCVLAMEPTTAQGPEDMAYAFAARVSEDVFVPLFLFEQDLKKWLPVLSEEDAKPVMYSMRHAPSADEILARIPKDAIQSFEDPELVITVQDFSEEEFE